MCSDTKVRIAEAVKQMMQTRPVCKITVQSVMERTQMKRQSFYYHFQDIYSVLEWIVETELCVPLQFDPEQTPADWCFQALTLLQTKQAMLRKISQALGSETLYRITAKIIRPQLDRLLPEHTAQDNTTHALALDMLAQAAFCTMDSMVVNRTPLNVDESMRKLRALDTAVRGI